MELTEVEGALRNHPEIQDAAVRAQDEALVAYVVPGGDERPDVRAFLAESLPAYMIPTSVVILDALPLARSGKVDREKLPRVGPSKSEAPVPPRTETERKVAEIWCEVLGLEELSVHDDFFSLGGHSLLATRIVNRMERSFGVEVPLSALFESGTVSQMAERVEGMKGVDRERGEL
ncbi:MAG: phosphopantetheine-binding protein [Vicinamibacteria bacterium]